MGLAQQDTTLNGTGVIQTTSIPIQIGRLKSVSLVQTQSPAYRQSTWGELTLSVGGTATVNQLAVLASGYLSNTQGLSWTGDLPIHQPSFITARTNSLVTGNIRLSSLTE